MTVGASPLSRVLVVGRRRPFVEALREYLGADARVDATSVIFDGRDPSLGLQGAAAPDVAVLDCAVAEDEEALLPVVRDAFPGSWVVVLARSPRREQRGAAPGAGVVRVGREAAALELLEMVLAPGVPAPRQRRAQPGQRPASLAPLSGRETRVLSLIVGGCSLAEVAELLEISPHTVRSHVQNVMAKLGARSRVEMVNAGRRAGLRPSGSGARS